MYLSQLLRTLMSWVVPPIAWSAVLLLIALFARQLHDAHGHSWWTAHVAAANYVAFHAYVLDKILSINSQARVVTVRVPELLLIWGFALLGGLFGGLVGMTVGHKTGEATEQFREALYLALVLYLVIWVILPWAGVISSESMNQFSEAYTRWVLEAFAQAARLARTLL